MIIQHQKEEELKSEHEFPKDQIHCRSVLLFTLNYARISVFHVTESKLQCDRDKESLLAQVMTLFCVKTSRAYVHVRLHFLCSD